MSVPSVHTSVDLSTADRADGEAEDATVDPDGARGPAARDPPTGGCGGRRDRRPSRSPSTSVLAFALFWPIWGTHPTTVSEFGGDQFATMWFLQWVPHALQHGLNPFFSQYANHPFGVNLLTNTSVVLLGLLASPVTWLWGPVASFNVLITLAMPASATAGYFFARRWVAWPPAAFVAGLLFGFGPFEIAQSAGHLNLTFHGAAAR